MSATPLLTRSDSVDEFTSARSAWSGLLPCLSTLGIETAAEATIVASLGLQAYLANSVFVLGRNLGPVFFMSECGADNLTSAILVSGLSVLVTAPVYTKVSRGRLASEVNLLLTLFCAMVLFALSVPMLVTLLPYDPNDLDNERALHRFIRYFRGARAPCAFAMFIAQDVLTLLLMMQSASLAQATLNSYSAKRLLGLIQLGCSVGAVTTGLAAGTLAHTIGTHAMLLVQIGVLLASLAPHGVIQRAEERMRSSGEKRRAEKAARKKQEELRTDGAVAPAPAPSSVHGEWWRSGLILSMALWTFSIIFCKTIVEYQYNVMLAGRVSSEQMVALTGYLYAAAGVLSSLLNAFGTGRLLRFAGMGVVLMMSPGAELVAAALMVGWPSIGAAFLGRTLDLTMRWSLNNTAKSLLWIATPRVHQEQAKPWVEGTVKKATASVTAIAIGVTLWLTGNSESALALLSATVAGVACLACMHMHRLYSDSMWRQVRGPCRCTLSRPRPAICRDLRLSSSLCRAQPAPPQRNLNAQPSPNCRRRSSGASCSSRVPSRTPPSARYGATRVWAARATSTAATRPRSRSSMPPWRARSCRS